ncbi:hypothetical protein [Ruegeria sp. HKCCD8929]|uniref:hypothetical protein n=1 Tax=Ruegeria sp. HKCCD8929 TaxID=2683006 RepID=UPI00148802CF|nr:hypothetical protein [Ruegeria sp. HKCCD8929]
MNSQAKLRNDYFSAKGLGSPPSSQTERRARAESLVRNRTPPLFEAALMLFDPSEDHNDPDWLQLMGWVYSQKIGNPLFDTDKANLFFSRASDILASSENYGDQVDEFDKKNEEFRGIKIIEVGEDCCNKFFTALLHHLQGESDPQEIKWLYASIPEGTHKNSNIYQSWIENGLTVKSPIPFSELVNSKSVERVVQSITLLPDLMPDEEQRGVELLFEASFFLGPPFNSLWHQAKMANDLKRECSKIADLEDSISQVGLIHNVLDEHGVPVAGLLRERHPDEIEGWLDIDLMEFSSGDFFVSGSESGALVPMITQDDLDVVAFIAFLDGANPTPPVFSLDRVPSGRTDTRFDRKTFYPEWLAATPVGQSMYLADWLMKGIMHRDGVPSLTNPFASGATKRFWHPPAIVESIGNATGSWSLPDGNRAANSRFAIVVRSVDLSCARFGTAAPNFEGQYRIDNINIQVESSLYNGRQDARNEEQYRENDPATEVGAKAQRLNENYQEIADLFPVFERVAVILPAFSVMCRARSDGAVLSEDTKRRITRKINAYKRDFETNFPNFELSPKPFHKGGCNCNGGIAARTESTVSRTQFQSFVPRPKQSLFSKNIEARHKLSSDEKFRSQGGKPNAEASLSAARNKYQTRALEIQMAMRTRDSFNISGDNPAGLDSKRAQELEKLHIGLMQQARNHSRAYKPIEKEIVGIAQRGNDEYTYLTVDRLAHILEGHEGLREEKFKKYTGLGSATAIVDSILEASVSSSQNGEPQMIEFDVPDGGQTAQLLTVLSDVGNGWIVTAYPRRVE